MKDTSGLSRWQAQAQSVTIYRDSFGIPHIYGRTDADAVFGLMYAQCEDDFARIEMNYLEKLGRVSEVNGNKYFYDDLLNQMIIDTAASRQDYETAPAWLKKLCAAFADGINFYLYKHPAVRPKILARFEPWYPMMWTDGSIGAISTADVNAKEFQQFYSNTLNQKLQGLNRTKQNVDLAANAEVSFAKEEILTGSNGFAFGPKISASGNAILYINPHVTFYFRPEVHMVSDEGLNAYGAVTWGQFFIYQGFNERCGWMHTSSYTDAADSYAEQVRQKGSSYEYFYDGKWLPVLEKTFNILSSDGLKTTTKSTKTYYTHHGPIMAKRTGKWLSVRADNRLRNGLIQCWERTKASGLKSFEETLALNGNISNNTVYADADGNIAYWHGNRIPKRSTKYNWSKPVDGSTKATEWQGLHTISETVHMINPPNGWLQNCNATPYTVAGKYSPKAKDFPAYMAPDGENFRGLNAVRVLAENTNYDLDKIIAAGYDTRLTAFELLVPKLIRVYDKTAHGLSTSKDDLYKAINIMKKWDFRSSESSVATTLAITWGEKLLPVILKENEKINSEMDIVDKVRYSIANGKDDIFTSTFLSAINELKKDYGDFEIPWGDINRFQRISPEIENVFDDTKKSYPVGFVSSAWGMLPSYTSRYFDGSKNRYGVNGNSFICAVEFGKTIKAKSLLAGGESADPGSPHFFDQAEMYSKGKFKDVSFYKRDVLAASVHDYHPGE